MVELDQFIATKNGLLRYYSTLRASQGVHLIGFAAGLFTLIQTVQYSRQQPLSGIFTNISAIFLDIVETLGLSETLRSVGAIVGFIFLFGSILVLLSFVFRSIFRFAVFAYFADYVLRVKLSEISQDATPIHHAIHRAVMADLEKAKIKLYLRFPVTWFFVNEGRKHWWGYAVCWILAILSTSILVGLLW